MSPYASIVVPTFDRASTLAASIRSALRQTVQNIEVIICGDGATEDVRTIVHELERQDGRVRFLDFPKAPHRGAVNRHRAVEDARSERIFYNDDDDLLLPHHVETLGPELDHAGIVSTPVISVQTDGRISLGLEDSSHPLIRQLFVDDRYKGIFDTHIAHRKSSYRANDANWGDAADRRPVTHMLKGFAANPAVVWRNIHRITALSFHGACRTGMPAQERAGELARWTKEIETANATEASLRHRGTYAFHAMRLFRVLRPLGHMDDETQLTPLLGHTFSSDFFTTHQSAQLSAMRALFLKQQAPVDVCVSLLEDLANARLGSAYVTGTAVQLLLRGLPRSTAQEVVESCTPRPAISLALFHLKARLKSVTEADIALVEAAMQDSEPWTRHHFGLSIVEALEKARCLDAAWRFCLGLEQGGPENSPYAIDYWRIRERVALARHDGHEADAARETWIQLEEQFK